MSDDASLIAAQHDSRRRFLELVAEIRPELHRYSARMVGSIADGEDVVQDTRDGNDAAAPSMALPHRASSRARSPEALRRAHA
jgi:hypothetical protein